MAQFVQDGDADLSDQFRLVQSAVAVLRTTEDTLSVDRDHIGQPPRVIHATVAQGNACVKAAKRAPIGDAELGHDFVGWVILNVQRRCVQELDNPLWQAGEDMLEPNIEEVTKFWMHSGYASGVFLPSLPCYRPALSETSVATGPMERKCCGVQAAAPVPPPATRWDRGYHSPSRRQQDFCRMCECLHEVQSMRES